MSLCLRLSPIVCIHYSRLTSQNLSFSLSLSLSRSRTQIFSPTNTPPDMALHIFFIFFFFISQSISERETSTITTAADADAATSSPSPPPRLHDHSAVFRPNIAVIIGVLTTLFSITFLLLLYAKHCKHGSVVIYTSSNLISTAPPRNSGIDRTVVESLPLFRFQSLKGHKDGLECAVCLTRFDPTELLRLLPKCKHAFHVECVDTWLDSHSTCPLCRYRVDPEDITLLHDVNIFRQSESTQNGQEELPGSDMDYPSPVWTHRVSGRHSSAGETNINNINLDRRSLDSVKTLKTSVTVGCFDRPRKDGLLLTASAGAEDLNHHRFEHRIIVSSDGSYKRWSDVQPTDLLYLRSEMIISDSRRFSLGSSRPSIMKNQYKVIEIGNEMEKNSSSRSVAESGRSVINMRSVSEITGLSRFPGERLKRKRHEGVVSRWMSWMSSETHHDQQQSHVSSDPHAHTSHVV